MFRYKQVFNIRNIFFKAVKLSKNMTTAIVIASTLICSCSYFSEGQQVRSMSREANYFFNQGNFEASLSKYKQIIEKHPAAADRILFEMGIIYAHPRNEKKDYQKSLECFREIVDEYPDSDYRRDSQMMIFQIHNVINKDRIIAAQQIQIETSFQGVKSREKEIRGLQEKSEKLAEQIDKRDEQIDTRDVQIEALKQTTCCRSGGILRCPAFPK